MSVESLSYDVGVLLGALRVPFKITNVIRKVTTQFLIADFGVVVSVFAPENYTMVEEKLAAKLKGWRHVYITDARDLNEKRYEVVWALMRSGYMKWIRNTYPAQFPNILDADNLSGRIIDERLARWGELPMYKYLVEDNKVAKTMPTRRILAKDPSFFDYMP